MVLRRWFSFCLCGGFVCPNCWLGFGVGICLFGAGLGRSVCAVVSFHFPLWSAPRVGIPGPNLAKRFEVRVVCLPCLNSAHIIPAVESAGPAGRLPSTPRFGGSMRPPRSHSGAPKGGGIIRGPNEIGLRIPLRPDCVLHYALNI